LARPLHTKRAELRNKIHPRPTPWIIMSGADAFDLRVAGFS